MTAPYFVPKGTTHEPTHRRTLSGRLVPRDGERPLGWLELLTDYTMSLLPVEKKERPDDGLHLTVNKVCSLCGVDLPDEGACVDKHDTVRSEHAVAEYWTNRRARRAAGQRSGYTQRQRARMAR